jgi:hypothetical protein
MQAVLADHGTTTKCPRIACSADQEGVVSAVRTWIKMSKRTASSAHLLVGIALWSNTDTHGVLLCIASCHATVQCDLSAGEEIDDTATEMTSTGRATPPPRRISMVCVVSEWHACT